MKSHAVFELGAGIPGVSGEENVSGPPMSGALAKEPGLVPCASVEGFLAPRMGSFINMPVVLGREADDHKGATMGPGRMLSRNSGRGLYEPQASATKRPCCHPAALPAG